MTEEFILIGDLEKYSQDLTSDYPVVVEIIPDALKSVTEKLKAEFPLAAYSLRKALSERGNHLLELKFGHWPALDHLNTFIKMMPGVIDHSLFYYMAGRAIISGPDGTEIIYPKI
jgi:ribose 5-phosphate isomerase A